MIVCVGDLMLDVLVLAAETQDAMPSGIYLRSGGSAANAASWAAFEGARAALVAAVGDDDAGDLLLRDLDRRGILRGVTRLSNTESGVVISQVAHGGNQAMHSARWAAAQLSPDHVPEGLLSAASVVHVTGYSMTSASGLSAARKALDLGHRAGALLSLDPSCVPVIVLLGRDGLIETIRQHQIDVIFPNRDEAAALTGEDDAATAAKALSHILRFAVVKDGARGCYLGISGAVEHIPTIATVAIDSTGAGDAFAGAWLAAYLREGDARNACISGNAAAARASSLVGGRPDVR